MSRLDTFGQDVRFGFRQLVRNPVFTVVALITLALGIGANTAIFSVVDGILFRPLPFPDSHALVSVWTDVSERGEPSDEWLSYANFHDLREETAGLDALAAWGGWRGTLTGEGAAEQVPGGAVTHDMFSGVLRVEPALGRDFRPDDDVPGAAGRVILSHGFWQRALAGDPDIIGRTLRMSGEGWEVIGVMPAGFLPPFAPDAQLWAPLRTDMSVEAPNRGGFYLRAIGRRAPGTSVDELDAELRVVGARLEESHPQSNVAMTFDAVPLRYDLVAEARTGLLVLLAAVAFVLLVACVNVANLLLARSVARREELAVRSALGAPRGRIVGQMLTEAGLLALVGGFLGVIVAIWGTDLLVALAPEGTPRLEEVGVDGRVLAVTAIITLLAGALFGLVPAIRAGREDAVTALREGGRGEAGTRGGARARSTLVVAQVAVALVLLIGAGLLVQSFQNLRVERVALTSTLPLSGLDGDVSFDIEGEPVPEPGQSRGTWFRRVTPGYFETMGIRVVAGRPFTPADNAGATPVLIINQTFANREESRVATYSPYAQTPAAGVSPVLRTTVPPASVVPAVRRAITELDETLAAGGITTLDELVSTALAPDRFVAMLLSLFAGLALLLAVVGLYGVVSYGVGRRLPEFGVRLVLGAAGRDVAVMILRQSLILVAVGVGVGLVAAVALTRLLGGLLFGVPALDPLTFAGVTLLLLGAGGAAAALPAIRAARLDPMRVLTRE